MNDSNVHVPLDDSVVPIKDLSKKTQQKKRHNDFQNAVMGVQTKRKLDMSGIHENE